MSTTTVVDKVTLGASDDYVGVSDATISDFIETGGGADTVLLADGSNIQGDILTGNGSDRTTISNSMIFGNADGGGDDDDTLVFDGVSALLTSFAHIEGATTGWETALLTDNIQVTLGSNVFNDDDGSFGSYDTLLEINKGASLVMNDSMFINFDSIFVDADSEINANADKDALRDEVKP